MIKTVPWLGPARTGDKVYFTAINGRYTAAKYSGDLQVGWTFIGHSDRETAKVKIK